MKPELGPTRLTNKSRRSRTYSTPVRGEPNTRLETQDNRPLWQRIIRTRTVFQVTVIQDAIPDDRIPDGDTIKIPRIEARSPQAATRKHWDQVSTDAETAKGTKQAA